MRDRNGNDDRKLGEAVRTLRSDRGLSQRSLASKLYVAQPIVCAIEQGRQPLTVSRAKAIASVLEVSLEELCAIAFGNEG